jgi:hypothetical protein
MMAFSSYILVEHVFGQKLLHVKGRVKRDVLKCFTSLRCARPELFISHCVIFSQCVFLE